MGGSIGRAEEPELVVLREGRGQQRRPHLLGAEVGLRDALLCALDGPLDREVDFRASHIRMTLCERGLSGELREEMREVGQAL